MTTLSTFLKNDLGYNFPSLESIIPFLEKTTSGISTTWAQDIAYKLKCYVTVGYPEVTADEPLRRYNSTVTVTPDSRILKNYRKSFLYYTDETWASEGDEGFFAGKLDGLGTVALGICMDINPYQFMSPWDQYEFATKALFAEVPLVVLSMAWLTHISKEELQIFAKEPESKTVLYWIERFKPILTSRSPKPTIIVCANRCGWEGESCYAGSTVIMRFHDGKVTICGSLGRLEENILIANTSIE